MIINIEGTDCSGKETQSKLLVEMLQKNGYKAELLSFPNYDTPTGKIVGGPYLGKKHITEGWFSEGATNVDAKVASLYFAADRKYNEHIIKDLEEKGYVVVLNRYVESNMAHQASKLKTKEEREEMFKFLEELEYNLLKLPKADITLLLYMPYENACILKANREEKPDQHELDGEYLKRSEQTYLELAKRNNYIKLDCVENNKILTREEMSEKVWNSVKNLIK